MCIRDRARPCAGCYSFGDLSNWCLWPAGGASLRVWANSSPLCRELVAQGGGRPPAQDCPARQS
eukprot:3592265-Alexandrium_andersonii.AAC.1